MDPEKNAMQIELDKLTEQNELMRKLATREGFYAHYFSLLKSSRTHEAAFHKVNDLCFELFGKHRYSDLKSFKNANGYHHKKK